MMGINTKTPRIARFHVEAAPRFELGDGGFADLCLTTWLCCHTQIDSIPNSRGNANS
jgi:hypothetical protein